MKHLILLLTFISIISIDLRSSHSPGGDVRIQQIGANQFIIHYRLVSEWLSQPSSLGTNIYDNITDTIVLNIIVGRDSVNQYINGSDTVGIYFYSDTFTLANNPNGYYSIYEICCRPIIASGGNVFTCNIPDPAIMGGNSNPNFTETPGRMNMCVNQTKTLDFSCSDLDGDSLVYSLIQPYSGTASVGVRPFNLIAYNIGFSLSNILGPGSVCTINPATGIVTTLPRQIGLYIIAVKCEEYRNGIKIGEVIRDVTIPALNCPFVSLKENKKENNISVYPNPSNGIFNISTTEPTKVDVYNVNGLKIQSHQLNNANNKIDLTKSNKGIYILKFVTNNSQYYKKVIVN